MTEGNAMRSPQIAALYTLLLTLSSMGCGTMSLIGKQVTTLDEEGRPVSFQTSGVHTQVAWGDSRVNPLETEGGEMSGGFAGLVAWLVNAVPMSRPQPQYEPGEAGKSDPGASWSPREPVLMWEGEAWTRQAKDP